MIYLISFRNNNGHEPKALGGYIHALTSCDVKMSVPRCGEMGARLVSMESEGENEFVVENMLWIGFLGEAYTGQST